MLRLFVGSFLLGLAAGLPHHWVFPGILLYVFPDLFVLFVPFFLILSVFLGIVEVFFSWFLLFLLVFALIFVCALFLQGRLLWFCFRRVLGFWIGGSGGVDCLG